MIKTFPFLSSAHTHIFCYGNSNKTHFFLRPTKKTQLRDIYI